SVHPHRHVMAADAAERDAAVRDDRRRVVRAPGAEVRQPPRLRRERRDGRVLLVEKTELLLDARARVEAREARREHARDHGRLELPGGRQERRAALVLLADDQWPLRRRKVVELLLDLTLDERALLLDDEDLLDAARELTHDLGLERPAHADLQEPDAEIRGGAPVDAEVLERLHHVEMRLAGRHDAEARPRRIDHETVQGVRARERDRGRKLVALEPYFLVVRRIRPANVEAARRHLDLRTDDRELVGRERHDLGRVGDLLRDLQSDPAAGEPRQLESEQSEVDDLLDIRWIQHRNHRVDEREFALVRQRRRFADVVVAGGDEHAAVPRRARGVTVLERIAGAVDAGTLAVPQPEHAVVARAGEEARLLRAPDRRRREILVQPRLEADIGRVEILLRTPQLAVET